MTRHSKGTLWIGTGLLLIAVALSLSIWNQLESIQAGAAAKTIVRHLEDFVSSDTFEMKYIETLYRGISQ